MQMNKFEIQFVNLGMSETWPFFLQARMPKILFCPSYIGPLSKILHTLKKSMAWLMTTNIISVAAHIIANR